MGRIQGMHADYYHSNNPVLRRGVFCYPILIISVIPPPPPVLCAATALRSVNNSAGNIHLSAAENGRLKTGKYNHETA
jgi:hypothetical protein